MASSAQSRAATWRAEPGATSLGHPRACKLVTEFISTPERDTQLQLPLLGWGRHMNPAQGAREAFTGGCREHHPQPGQADPPQHPHSQALPPPSSHPALRRQPGSLLPEKSHALPGNVPLFFFFFMLHCSFNKDTNMQSNATCQRELGRERSDACQ